MAAALALAACINIDAMPIQQPYKTGAMINDIGSQLRVILPDGVTFPGGSRGATHP